MFYQVCFTYHIDYLFEEEKADHGDESREAKPDGLLVLVMVVAMMPLVARLAHLGEESVRKEVEERVPGESPHRQGDQELDEVLVEGLLQLGHILFIYLDTLIYNWMP